MKHFWLFFVPLMMMVALVSCKEVTEPGETEWYCYSATQCADPWRSLSGTLDEQVSLHLENNGVEALAVDTVHSDTLAAVCLACPCTAGYQIQVQVSTSDAATIEALDEYPVGGWYKCED